MGFSYKLEEYFSPDVFDMAFMEPFVVPLAFLACVAEIVLGLAVILGAKMKLASWSLLGLTVFFGFLTWFSAYYDKVRECGCFGDALSLTPWESFYKDMFLMVFVIILVLKASKIKLNTQNDDLIVGGLGLLLVAVLSLGIFDWGLPVVLYIILIGGAIVLKRMLGSSNKEWIMAGYVTLLTSIFGIYTYNYLPVKDYRAYAVGKSISEQMKTAEEKGEKPTTYYTLYTLVDESGNEKEVRSDVYLKDQIWKDKSLKIDKEQSKGPYVLEAGYEPAITDFKIDSYEDGDLTHEVLDAEEPTLVWVFKSIEKAQTDPDMAKLISLTNELGKNGGMKVLALSPSPYEEVESFRHENNLAFPFYAGDEIVLKTFVRSNPGLILMKKGTVLGKWSNNDLPSADEVKALAKN